MRTAALILLGMLAGYLLGRMPPMTDQDKTVWRRIQRDWRVIAAGRTFWTLVCLAVVSLVVLIIRSLLNA